MFVDVGVLDGGLWMLDAGLPMLGAVLLTPPINATAGLRWVQID
jgi:hypothetical protein